MVEKDMLFGYNSLQDSVNDCKCSSQADVLARMLMRENVYIGGPPGSGKSTVVKTFIDTIREDTDNSVNIAVTASTGIAAKLIGGITLHSFAGIYPGDTLRESMERVGSRSDLKSGIKDTDVLIIDEISMLPPEILDSVNEIMQYYRQSTEPFGGVQVIFMGDFLQLPPVRRRGDEYEKEYAYEADSWKNANLVYCYLDKIHRARDEDLQRVLIAMANGKMGIEEKAILQERVSYAPDGADMRDPKKAYTNLFTKNMDIDTYNNKRLAENPNPPSTFSAFTSGDTQSPEMKKLLKSTNYEEVLSIKDGATVMITANKYGAVNGDIGVVQRVVTRAGFRFIVVLLNDGREIEVSYISVHAQRRVPNRAGKGYTYIPVGSLSYVPLKLAYAVTVHKSQGQTYDGVVADLSNCFSPGLGYVALSRVRSLDDLIITDINDRAFKMNETGVGITRKIKKKGLDNRKAVLDNIDLYESVLTNKLSRSVYWSFD